MRRRRNDPDWAALASTYSRSNSSSVNTAPDSRSAFIHDRAYTVSSYITPPMSKNTISILGSIVGWIIGWISGGASAAASEGTTGMLAVGCAQRVARDRCRRRHVQRIDAVRHRDGYTDVRRIEPRSRQTIAF